MAWTDLVHVAYKAIMSSDLVNALIDNDAFLKSDKMSKSELFGSTVAAVTLNSGLWSQDPDDPIGVYTSGAVGAQREIRLQGSFRNANTGPITGASEFPIGTLPAGTAPAQRRRWPAVAYDGTKWISAYIKIENTGSMSGAITATTPSLASGVFLFVVGSASWRATS